MDLRVLLWSTAFSGNGYDVPGCSSGDCTEPVPWMIKINKASGHRLMECVFIGNPRSEEIELYLRNRRYSLLNNTKLRNDIISRRVQEISFGAVQPDCTGEVENVVPAEELSGAVELKFEFLKEETERDGHDTEEDGFAEGMKRRAAIGSIYGKVLGEENVNTLHARSACVNRRTGNRDRRLVARNTAKNSGYRFVRLSTVDGGRLESVSVDDVACRRHERKVRFVDEATAGMHNGEDVPSILLPSDKPRKMPGAKVKETVLIESLGCFDEDDGDRDFEFVYTG